MAYNTLTRTFTDPAVTITCYKCGIPFAVPSAWQADRLRLRDAFWCPNGHEQYYTGKSEAEKLRDQLVREQHRREQAEADANWQRRQRSVAERQVAARKGQVTKLRKRLEKGVCPCCDRYFPELHRHMEAQHPDWRPEDAAPAVPPAPVGYTARERLAWTEGASAAPGAVCPYRNRGRGVALHRAWEAGHAAATTQGTEGERDA